MSEAAPPWTDLLSLAVHELRSPVNVVSGYVKMLLGGYGGSLSPAQRQALEAADQSSVKVVALLAEISELSRLAGGRLSLARDRVPLGDLLEDAAARFVPPLDHGVRCVVEAGASHAATVEVDRTRTARALATMAAAVARRQPTASSVTLGVSAHGDAVAIVVAAGEAATPVVGPDDFDPLPETDGGLGVGLPLARLVVEGAGGRAVALRTTGAFTLAVVLPLSQTTGA